MVNNKLTNLTMQLVAEVKRQACHPQLQHLGPLVGDLEKELKREHKKELDGLRLQRLQRALLDAGLPLSRDPVEWLNEIGPQIKRMTVEEQSRAARQMSAEFGQK